MQIYYEDSEIIVCEKPYGVDCEKGMIALIKEERGAESFPVHRLDIKTTGVMAFAKTRESAAYLSSHMDDFSKEYLALCHGELDGYGEMRDYLYHDKRQNKSFAVNTKRSGAKEAILHFSTQGKGIYKGKELTLVKIKLITGRTHQIRAQLSKRGCVLYGDGKYGAKDNDKIALHAFKLSFNHPKTKERLEFISLPTSESFLGFYEQIAKIPNPLN